MQSATIVGGMQTAANTAGSAVSEPPGGCATYAFVTVAGSAESGDIRQVGCGNLHLYLNGNATVSAALAVTVYAGLGRFVAQGRGGFLPTADLVTTTPSWSPPSR